MTKHFWFLWSASDLEKERLDHWHCCDYQPSMGSCWQWPLPHRKKFTMTTCSTYFPGLPIGHLVSFLQFQSVFLITHPYDWRQGCWGWSHSCDEVKRFSMFISSLLSSASSSFFAPTKFDPWLHWVAISSGRRSSHLQPILQTSCRICLPFSIKVAIIPSGHCW